MLIFLSVGVFALARGAGFVLADPAMNSQRRHPRFSRPDALYQDLPASLLSVFPGERRRLAGIFAFASVEAPDSGSRVSTYKLSDKKSGEPPLPSRFLL